MISRAQRLTMISLGGRLVICDIGAFLGNAMLLTDHHEESGATRRSLTLTQTELVVNPADQ